MHTTLAKVKAKCIRSNTSTCLFQNVLQYFIVSSWKSDKQRKGLPYELHQNLIVTKTGTQWQQKLYIVHSEVAFGEKSSQLFQDLYKLQKECWCNCIQTNQIRFLNFMNFPNKTDVKSFRLLLQVNINLWKKIHVPCQRRFHPTSTFYHSHRPVSEQ